MAMVDEFKQVYKEKGPHDFQSQIKYLAALADFYHKKGADNSDWVCLLKAHALYNSTATRDSQNRDSWSQKAFEVQKTYWGEKVQLSYEQQKEITDGVKGRLTDIRKNTQSKLDHIKHNFMQFECDVEQLTSELNEKLYKDFMKHMESTSKNCTDAMVKIFHQVIGEAVEIAGEPPCQFCVAAMGSIARGEATPYSDLEFLFLIEMDSAEIVKYFELLALTTYFFIGNLQETKLRYMAVEELDFWFTDECTNGIKIDGLQPWAGNIPTGNGFTEQHNHYICTIYQLACRYTQVYNNPHPKDSLRGDLTAMLSCLIPIFGNTNLLSEFRGLTQQLKPNEARQNASRNMLQNDVRKFNFYPDSSLNRKRNMKIDIYRYPSMLLMNLKIVHQLDQSSAEIINELVSKSILSQSIADHLRFTFCCSLYIRLSAYLYHNSQNENISVLSVNPDFLTTRDQWYMDRSLMLHMMIHLMPLKQAVLDAQLTTNAKISLENAKRAVAAVSYFTADYQTCYLALKELNSQGLNIHTEYRMFADCALQLGYCEEAEWLASQQLEFLLKLHEGKDDPEVSYAYNQLGNILEYNGKSEEAESSLLKSLEIDLRLYDESDHADLASSYNNLGILYDNQGEYEKARVHYEKSLEMRQRMNSDSDHPHITESLNNLGQLCGQLGDYTAAEMYHIKSLEMSQRLYGNADYPDIACSYNNLCHVYESLGNFKNAEECGIKSLEMNQRLHGNTDHPEISTCYDGLGNLCESQGDYKKAEMYHTKSLEMTQRMYNADHPEIATSHNNLGTVYNSLGDYKKAEEHLLKALEVRTKLYGDTDHPEIGACYINLGNAYEGQRENTKAENYHTRALELYRRLYDNADHPDIADSHSNLGNIYHRMGDYNKAEVHHVKSLEMHQRLQGDTDQPDVAASHVNLGEVYCSQGLYQKAEEHCLKSLQMLNRIHGESDHTVIAVTRRILGDVYCGQGLYEKAEELLTKSLDMTSRLFANSDHLYIADCYNSLGSLYKGQGELDKAEQHYIKVLEMRQRIFRDDCDNPDIASCYKNLSDTLARKGELEKSGLYRMKWEEIENRLGSRQN